MTQQLTTWRTSILEEMEQFQENWNNVVATTLTEEQLDQEFDSNYGTIEGIAFTLWTFKRVYFPVTYDGAEYCGSVSRDPDGRKTTHIGGL